MNLSPLDEVLLSDAGEPATGEPATQIAAFPRSQETSRISQELLISTVRSSRSVMATPRSQLVDRLNAGDYHCVSRCVRRAFLCGDAEGAAHRKDWIEDEVVRFAGIFAIQVTSFALMDNHMHLGLRTRPDVARSWSDEEVVRRWARLHEPSVRQRAEALRWQAATANTSRNESEAVSDGSIDESRDDRGGSPASRARASATAESGTRAKTNARTNASANAGPPLGLEDAIAIIVEHGGELVQSYRRQLSCLSKYHQVLKHSVAVRANREDGCRGHFWEARFSSVRIMDEEHLLATMMYIDLNPIRAGVARTPEHSEHTSIRERIRRLLGSDRGRVRAASGRRESGRHPSSSPPRRGTGAFLAPMNRRTHADGIIDGLSERRYISLVDQMGRLIRPDKRGSIPRDLPPILVRLARAIERLSEGVTGSVLGGSPDARRAEARRRGSTLVRGACLVPI